jgi:ubiquinone/menaquinone biosynthesis C-methylase UbiE
MGVRLIIENYSYQGFARVYDEMMAERDYARWAAYVAGLAEKYGVRGPGKMLDLACGTGSFLIEMAARGWLITGVDNSAEMLGVADAKLNRSPYPFHLVQQDMRELDIGQSFTLITCMCDSLNYLIEPIDLQKTLGKIKLHLAPGGILIADMNLESKYRLMLGDGSFAETFANSAYIWENSYDPESRTCRMAIDFFVRVEGELFRHIPEVHLQRAYWQQEIVELAKEAGFTEVEFWRAFSDERLNPMEEQRADIQVSDEKLQTGEEFRYEDGRMFVVMR